MVRSEILTVVSSLTGAAPKRSRVSVSVYNDTLVGFIQ